MNYTIIILAAGSSERLGQSKQLLPFNETTLLNYTISECKKSGLDSIYLILGYDAQKIIDSLVEPLKMFINPNYKLGLGTSMAYACTLLSGKSYDALIFVLCDQIYFKSSHISELIEKFESGNCEIVISKYNSAQGPPSLFSSKYMDKLKKLTGDEGAKSIVKKNKDKVCFIDFPKGGIDIDTEEDLSKMF